MKAKHAKLKQISLYVPALLLINIVTFPNIIQTSLQIGVFAMCLILSYRYYNANLKIFSNLLLIIGLICSPFTASIIGLHYMDIAYVLSALTVFIVSLSLKNLNIEPKTSEVELSFE